MGEMGGPRGVPAAAAEVGREGDQGPARGGRMTPQPKRPETARSSIEHDESPSVYRSVLGNAPGGSATSPHDPTRDLAVLSRPLPHPIDRTRSAFDVPGPEAPPPFGARSGPAFSTPPNISPSMESPEEPAPVRGVAGIPVLESTIRGDAVLSGPVSVAGP